MFFYMVDWLVGCPHIRVDVIRICSVMIIIDETSLLVLAGLKKPEKDEN